MSEGMYTLPCLGETFRVVHPPTDLPWQVCDLIASGGTGGDDPAGLAAAFARMCTGTWRPDDVTMDVMMAAECAYTKVLGGVGELARFVLRPSCPPRCVQRLWPMIGHSLAMDTVRGRYMMFLDGSLAYAVRG